MLRFLRRSERPSGAALRAQGNEALAAARMQEAADCYRRAAQADPADPLACVNLGYVLLETGDAQAAAASLQEALQRAPAGGDFAHEAHYLLGRARAALGRPDDALASFSASAQLRPGFTPALRECVALLRSLGRSEEALDWARRWSAADPEPSALVTLGHLLYERKRHDEALAALEAALARDPANAAAMEGRGSVRLALGRPGEALADFDAALALGAATVGAQLGRAAALRRLGRTGQALAATGLALAADPGHREALGLHAVLLADALRLPEADATLTRAHALHPADPDLRWTRAIVRLLAGDFAGGWPDYEFRRWAPSAGLEKPFPDYGIPPWTGKEDLRGKSILVIGEQGLGDALQFARYVPLLQERGARVILHVVPALHALFEDAFAGCEVVSGGDLPTPDFHALLLSLPLAFGTTLATIPARVPYLRSRQELREMWEERLGPRRGPRVGLVWSGNPRFTNDATRSMTLDRLRAIAVPGIQFVSLQKELRPVDRESVAAWEGLQHVGEQIRDFADTAALAACMDLVVSTDTSVAHLAGALGLPLRVLLSQPPDWRWLLDRGDSPWYPTARLVRQPRAGDWDTVLAAVRGELEALARASGMHATS